MKKIYVLLSVAMMAGAAQAQQLPNVGFEEPWVDSTPWNTVEAAKGLTMVKGDAMGQITFGQQPASWCVSNVLGIVSERDADYGGGYAGLGATEICAKAEGYNSETALSLTNNPNPFMTTQIVPAYVTLGTTWSTSYVDFTTFQPAGKDGGSFGGIEFTTKPDALQFYYKRSNSTEEGAKAENSTVVAYLWKGTWTQKDVPGDIQMSQAGLTKTDMVNRDRNILGMETAEGGDVTKTDDAELIAVLNTEITEMAADWTKFIGELSYKTNSTPAMANVIISAGNYFGGSDVVGKDNNITIDDVKFIYYSRIKSLKFGEAVIPVAEGQFEVEIPMAMPTDMTALAAMQPEFIGAGARLDMTSMKMGANTISIDVVNDGEDIDGKKAHTYTLKFAEATDEPAGEAQVYNGYLNVVMFGGNIAENQASTIEITMTGENTCDFVMPNFAIDLGQTGTPTPMGDIKVTNVKVTTEGDVTKYEGHEPSLKLMMGAIEADVTINGTITAGGVVDMKIDVLWNNGGTLVPIACTFTSAEVSGINDIMVDENAPVEYYNLQGVRVANPENGIFIRRQGKKATKVIL